MARKKKTRFTVIETAILKPLESLNDLTSGIWDTVIDQRQRRRDIQRGMDGEPDITTVWASDGKSVRVYIGDDLVEFVYQCGSGGSAWLWNADRSARTVKAGLSMAIKDARNPKPVEEAKKGGGFLSDLNTDSRNAKKRRQTSKR